ncbi:hypothetical protein RC74_03440 [Falsihalocynthiibacter arcticus]|uniref:histidine kinase n=2 Tax=Falsihalocynthiibacter arcticus TaxID=1579316 RepID=A0A126UXS1_9RHOB|nr:hypothetical protein RC74_03440 [Falsihalocynthiibacter arcticus]
MVISLGISSISFKIIPTQLDAKAGPLILAGYLGGPIGGLIAALCGAYYRITFGGPMLGIAVFMNLATAAIGVTAHYLTPSTNWPTIQKSTIKYIIVAFVLLHLIPLWYLSSLSDAPSPYAVPSQTLTAFIVVGIMSILATWQIMNYSLKFVNDGMQSADLANQLGLVMDASGMGKFDHKIGSAGPVFDTALMKIYGLDRPAGTLAQSEWEAIIHRDDIGRLRAQMQQTWLGEKVNDKADFRACHSDGSLRYIRATWTSETDRDGKVSRVVGLHADLSDIHEAKQQLQKSRDRLGLIAEKIPGVILEYDATDPNNPELLYISPKCIELWGVTDAEFYADHMLLTKMHAPEDIDYFLASILKGIRTSEPIFHRYSITTLTGQTRWLDYHGKAVSESGKLYVKAIILDATREVEAQGQAEMEREISRNAQKIESIGQLTGGVAHDFNNLLAVILGNLELLRDSVTSPPENTLIETAINATLRGADLTRNMLAFARKAPLTPIILDLNTVVRETKNWIGRALPESIIVETSLLAGLWPVEVDRASLESALLNLTLNARDAMEDHGSLTIETANVRIEQPYIDARKEELIPGRYVMLAVSDTGPGIPNEILGSIFEPFFTTKPTGKGSGLGLSMTFGFMRQSGGTVRVYTEINQGTTFKLYFPVASSLHLPPTEPVEELPTASKGYKLLIAEDETAVRDVLVMILERAGYQVMATTSGDAAFAVFEADPSYNLLLTDIVMPGQLQGTTLAKKLRKRWPDLPVIFMSGYASEATVHGNGLRPEDIRMMKPVQRADLLMAVEKVLSSS